MRLGRGLTRAPSGGQHATLPDGAWSGNSVARAPVSTVCLPTFKALLRAAPFFMGTHGGRFAAQSPFFGRWWQTVSHRLQNLAYWTTTAAHFFSCASFSSPFTSLRVFCIVMNASLFGFLESVPNFVPRFRQIQWASSQLAEKLSGRCR